MRIAAAPASAEPAHVSSGSGGRWTRACVALISVLAALGTASPAVAGHGNNVPEVAAAVSSNAGSCAPGTGMVGFNGITDKPESYSGSFNGSIYTLLVTPVDGPGAIAMRTLTFEISTTSGPLVIARQVSVGGGSVWNVYDYHHPTPTFGPGAAHDDGLRRPGSGASHVSFCVDQLIGLLPVTVRSFTVARSGGGVVVRWRTASELDVLGFNVIAEVKGKRVRLNRRLIVAKGGRDGTGAASYSWRARSCRAQRAARFWLEAVNVDGSRTPYGPILPRP